jgi:3-methyladenine DNA glycosylase AlkD
MDMQTLNEAKKEIRQHADPQKAQFLTRFFKTGPGQYADGDKFLGIIVPQTRKIANECKNLPLAAALKLLQSNFHEERLMALFILVDKYNLGSEKEKGKIFKEYLRLAPKYVNNWDLVDSSADKIVGKHLFKRPRSLLTRLAKSTNLWERRIALLATFHFIRQGQFADTLQIAEILLNDKHDLIHKAAGWMLREVGNRSMPSELAFLDMHARRMPRTMLRYAIERFPKRLKKKYMAVKA